MKSFLQREKSTALPDWRLSATAAVPGLAQVRGSGCARSGGGSMPHVDVIKEGDKVVRLVVTCGCGERVDIECLYAPGS
jgi:hypothetical protein